MLTEAKRHELAAGHHGLTWVLLLKQINGNLEKLWTLADRPTPRPKVTPKATRAYIRHNYTKYEDRLLDFGFPLESDDYLYREIKSETDEAVDKFLSSHRK
jgi:hypothetical protein